MAFADRRRARGLPLRHLLDLHQADAARSVDAEPGVITVVGNLDAGLDRRLQHGLALLYRELPAVDRKGNRLHNLPIIYRRGGPDGEGEIPAAGGDYRPIGMSPLAVEPHSRLPDALWPLVEVSQYHTPVVSLHTVKSTRPSPSSSFNSGTSPALAFPHCRAPAAAYE